MAMQIHRSGVGQMLGTGAQLVDVLSTKESEAEHIPGAINIPLRALVERRYGDSTVTVPLSSIATTTSET